MSRRLSHGTGEVHFDEHDGSEERDAAGYVAQDGLVHPAPAVPSANQPSTRGPTPAGVGDWLDQ